MVGIGLVLAIHAAAQTNTPYKSAYGESANFNLLGKSTLQNTPGIPNEADWEAFKKRQAYQKAASQNTKSPYACNCVLYAQSLGMPYRGYGAAKNYPINSTVPAESGWVITYESYWGHIGHYTRQGDYLLMDNEANVPRCRISHHRLIPINSSLIKGYIN